VIDGNKVILNRPGPDAKVEDCEFEPNEVYAIDIVVSSGEGKPRMLDEKETTVYKRALDMMYNLKIKASRAVFGEVGGLGQGVERLRTRIHTTAGTPTTRIHVRGGGGRRARHCQEHSTARHGS
jgi:hypothetical protein